MKPLYPLPTSPSRVLVLIDHLHTGGAQEFVLQLCKSVPRERVQISVCALRGGGHYVDCLERLGVPVLTLAPSAHPAWRPSALIWLWQLLHTGEYHLLHTLLEGSFLAGTPLSWLARVPSIHSLMAVRRQVAPWYFPLMRAYQPIVDCYATFAVDELLESGVQRTKVSAVEVAVDISELLQGERDRGLQLAGLSIAPDDLMVASIGRLHPDKGHEYAIRAWPLVLQQLPRARLLIVGDGADEKRLRSLIDELGLADAVILAGFRSDLGAILTRAELLVRASVNEGVNLTTIQAMAAGLPVVGFANLAPKEIIVDGRNGLLVPLRNSQALASALITLGVDAEMRSRLGAAARAAVGAYYNAQRIFGHYLALYEAIIGGEPVTSVPDMLTHPWPFTVRQSAPSVYAYELQQEAQYGRTPAH